MLFTLATAVLPVPRVDAADTICVALVVDFSPLGGNVDSGCTRVPSGASGYDVLHAGGHTYEVCNNGVIGTIDGKPANGCQIKDNNHFWGYWHRKPGSRTWTFSSYGAGFYHPGEGSTEGWVWEDGTTNPPADVPYPAGCHSPPRSPSPTPTPTATRHSSPAIHHSAAPATSPATRNRRGGTQPTGAEVKATKVRAHVTATASPGASDSRTPTPSSTTTAGATTEAGGDPPTENNTGGSHTVPLIVGVAAAAMLGAGAWWRFRVSRPT